MSDTHSSIVRRSGRANPLAALHVEVIADVVCPFCFIGKRRLDQALHAVQGPSSVSWHPYQLNPEIPAEGVPFDVYLTRRFGSPANIEPVFEHLAKEGADVGIDFRFDRIRHVPQTLLAHQVMHMAAQRDLDASALADDLMSAFFEEGRDIGDRGVLIAIGARHGLSADEVVAAAESAQLRNIVTTREARARANGLAGVPGFLLNSRLLVVGAQTTDTIVNAFDRAMFGEGTDTLPSPALH